MSVDQCSRCQKSLGTMSQGALPGTGVEQLCADCSRVDEARWMLKALPQAAEFGWSRLRESTRKFLTSLRRQFATKGTLSEGQLVVLQEIYREVE